MKKFVVIPLSSPFSHWNLSRRVRWERKILFNHLVFWSDVLVCIIFPFIGLLVFTRRIIKVSDLDLSKSDWSFARRSIACVFFFVMSFLSLVLSFYSLLTLRYWFLFSVACLNLKLGRYKSSLMESKRNFLKILRIKR